MNTDTGQQPPRRLSSQLVHLDHNLKAIEKKRYAGIQRAPDSLPVLEAFQSFLEEERRRMHRRLVMVSVWLFIIMGLAGAGAVATTLWLGQRVTEQQHDIERQRGDIEARARAMARVVTEAGVQSEAALVALAERIEQSRGDWHDGQSGLDARIHRHEESLSELALLVDSLREDNAALAVRLSSAAAELQRPGQIMTGGRPVATYMNPVRETEGYEPVAMAGAPVTLSILPRGANLPVRWLLPSVTTVE